jgi:UDP-galactopyranose mutase
MAAILVVGAGFAGAVYARTLAEAGHQVRLVDRRQHLGGNAADAVDANGVRVHRYGPHLFHTNSTPVFDWLRRFGAWSSYRHRVRAILPDGQRVPLPINRDTINLVFDQRLTTAEACLAFLQRIAVPVEHPANAADYLYGRVGTLLTDLLFRPYTRKMWGLELEDMDASVVRRLPLRLDAEDAYFPDDRYQALPTRGYTALFKTMLAHPRISVELGVDFSAGMEAGFAHCFNSMAIDEYFDFALGELPYRSLRFHHRSASAWPSEDCAVYNYTDVGPYTREAWWHCLPNHLHHETNRRGVTVEEPCDYRENGRERYYPVKTADGRYGALYRQYKRLAATLPRITFIGRCGTYQYLDMDQVISQSLTGARRWLSGQTTLCSRG